MTKTKKKSQIIRTDIVSKFGFIFNALIITGLVSMICIIWLEWGFSVVASIIGESSLGLPIYSSIFILGPFIFVMPFLILMASLSCFALALWGGDKRRWTYVMLGIILVFAMLWSALIVYL